MKKGYFRLGMVNQHHSTFFVRSFLVVSSRYSHTEHSLHFFSWRRVCPHGGWRIDNKRKRMCLGARQMGHPASLLRACA